MFFSFLRLIITDASAIKATTKIPITTEILLILGRNINNFYIKKKLTSLNNILMKQCIKDQVTYSREDVENNNTRFSGAHQLRPILY